MQNNDANISCYHCGTKCDDKSIYVEDKYFCCFGCKTVYEILSDNNMDNFYDLNDNPGTSLKKSKKSYDYLENEEIKTKLLEFSDGGISVVNLYLPAIHCSSCIWLLENLGKLQKGIVSVIVNFPKRTARISFRNSDINLKQVAELLSSIGYEPLISLEDTEKKKEVKDRSLLYKFGIAGFAFGNIMIMALPEYFDYNDTTLQSFLPFFRWLMLGLSIPVVFYSASDYFISAWKGLKHKFINIDVPIALGIAVLFLRSTYDILTHSGPGYFDSLAGLVFFLTLGKFFQRKTYESLSFERDYKSYFPVAVTLLGEEEKNIPVNELKPGDRILIRNEELIPADCVLINGNGLIDNSFVTGEATPVSKSSGELIYAGGRQCGEAIELEVVKSTDQSYLTQLWNHEVFEKEQGFQFKNLTDKISKYFTIAILLIATSSAAYWYFTKPEVAVTVFTAILIVACPCALALSAPFTLGNTLRIFGKNRFYVKNADTVESLASINHIVWDKTGTLTKSTGHHLKYNGKELTDEEQAVFRSMARQSNHPLSRLINNHLIDHDPVSLSDFQEYPGKGTKANYHDSVFAMGSSNFIGLEDHKKVLETRVYLSRDQNYLGHFSIVNEYRDDLKRVINSLQPNYKESVLSGDGPGEKKELEPLFGIDNLHFDQKPEDKLAFIESLQKEGDKVLMMGDGLNDAGALKKSDVGISISEDVNSFSPACDAILDASEFKRFNELIEFSKTSVKVIKWSFGLSFSYNIVGLYFAATAQLSPVVSAILMPLSSITIVVFVTTATNILAKIKKLD